MAPAIRVLYVDDEQGLLTISKLFLERDGSFTVDTCTSAREALTRLKTERYDAIVSDYQMPEMDGIGFLKQLKISGNTTPFIIFTGIGREEVVIEALNEGADFYIQKGGDPKSQFAELSNKICYAVTRRQVEDELSESQKRTAEIIEFLPDATFAINTEGVVIAWNRAMEIMTGVEKEKVLNKGNYEYSLPFYGERRPVLIDLVLDPDEKVSGKYPFIWKEGTNTISEISIPHFHDGRGAYLWFTASPLYNSQGVLSGAIESIRDITEQKRAEDALVESEVRYRHVVEDQTEFICRFLPDGTHVFVNEAYCRYFGISRDDILDTRFLPAIHPDDRGLVARLFASLTVDQPLMTIDQRTIMPDGSTRWQRWVDRAIFHANGTLKEYQSVGRDITRTKQDEEALRESEERFRTLLEQVPSVAVQGYLPDYTVVYWNEANTRMYGYTAEEAIGQDIRELIVPVPARDEVTTAIARMAETGIPEPSAELELLHKDGSLVPVFSSHAVVKIPGRSTVQFCFDVDLSDRKKAQDAIRESEERYRNVVEDQTEFICRFTPDGTFVFVNEAYCRYFGIIRDEIIGTRFQPAIHPDDRGLVARLFASLTVDQPLMTIDQRTIMPDGSTRWQRWVDRAIFHLNGTLKEYQSVGRDITGRKKVEEVLAESEAKYRSLFTMMRLMCDNVPDMIWAKDLEKRYIFVNKAICLDLLNAADTDEPVGKNDLFFAERERACHADDPGWHTFGEICRDTDQVTMDAGTPQQFDEYGNVQGDYLFLDVRKAPFLDEHGKMIGTVGSARDVTVSKLLEVALHESESFNRGLVENLPDYIAVYGQDGNLLYVNPASVKGLGYDADMLIGTHVLSYVAPEYRDTVTAKMATRWRGGDKSPYEIDIVVKNGLRRSVIVKATPIQYKHNSAVLLLLIDITKRKMAEDVTRRSEEKYREIFEHSVTGVFQTAPGGRIINVNEAFAQMYGFSDPAQMLAADLHVGSPPYAILEDRQELLRILEEKGMVENYVAPHLKRDGTKFWASINARTIRDADGSVLFYEGTIVDITERKVAEDALRQANKKLNLLTAITRHDINNQLTVLQGYLTLMGQEHPDSTHNEYFGKISTAAQRISAMIQSTKEYEEIGVHAPAWQDCRTLAGTAVKQATAGQVMVKNDLPASAEVFADPLVVKVFYNLVDNAVRYGGKITTIRFSALESGDAHLIVCEDDGVGVVAEDKAKIFNRGFGKNTGLGLALSREILSITGITITETGEPGKGARFEMVVPKGAWRMAGNGLP
ncbi:MAG: PAS domain S-box protein [Methanomicrobiales archaeon]|nr:PAS domain S-box protein [Methanomicrobiales archaeon]